MSYPYLTQGNAIPAVGVLQKLLNGRAASNLQADGVFGDRTRLATKEYQRQQYLDVDGIVGEQTWGKLKRKTDQLTVIDCVDVFDQNLWNSGEDIESRAIRLAGGKPIRLGGMSNGIAQLVSEILSVSLPNSVFLLRLHGHGAPGNAGMSQGVGNIPGDNRSAINLVEWPTIEPQLRRLKGIFGPYGCIQLMHCSVAKGAPGDQLLQRVADCTGVPCTAAVNTQLGGGITTFRFEGPTKSRFPGDHNLKTWSKKLPDFVGMSVS
jgi:hypothetical protein